MSAPSSPQKETEVADLTETPVINASTVIEKLLKPDKAEHDAQIAALNADIKNLRDRTVRYRILQFALRCIQLLNS